MLRITAKPCERGERLELQGRLTGALLLELERAVEESRRRSARLSLDLSELSFLDGDAARFLRELRAQGVEVRGSSAFVAELLGLAGSHERTRGGPC